MLDILDALIAASTPSPAVLARVIGVTGSSPRAVGSALVVDADGVVHGSVSSGCVESAVIAASSEVICTGDPVVERFGAAGLYPLAAGLTCGGEVDILIERVDDPTVFAELRSRVGDREQCALLTTVGGPTRRALVGAAEIGGHLADPWDAVSGDSAAMLDLGRSGLVGGDEVAGCRASVFVHSFASAPRMILAGANDFVRALADVGRTLGFVVTVVDARATFASPRRFPTVDEVVVDWPNRYLGEEYRAGRLDRRSVIAVMTHDDKFDVPTIRAALTLDRFAYVGAMGSRRTHADRMVRLVDSGVGTDDLDRLHSPMGLDLDARTPEETAVSIAAQIIAVRGGASGRPLSTLDGPIHR